MSDPEQTGRTVRPTHTALHPPNRPGIMDIHRAATEIANGGGDDPLEFVVSVDTSDVLIVRAESAEEAIAKAVMGNPNGSDFDIEVVSHDVHTCVHTGDEIEREEHHAHEGDDEE